MTTGTPKIDSRDKTGILEDLKRHVPGYVNEWTPERGTPGSALMHIFARYMEIYVNGLNRVPDRSFLVFLDSLGMSLLSAQSARAPLVFNLISGSPVDTTLPAGSQVVSPVQQAAPTPLIKNTQPSGKPENSEPIAFSTDKTITITRATLKTVHSLDPANDTYADYTSEMTSGFTLFDKMRQIEHELYLGHDTLFDISDNAEIELTVNLAGPDEITDEKKRRALKIEWEYLSKDGWLPLDVKDDQTEGFTKSGQISLQKTCGPDAKEEKINDHTSYWLRGLVRTPISSQDIDSGELPLLDTIRTSVSFTRRGLAPESAFTDLLPVDTANNFYPFSQEPKPYTTFYLASKEVFQRKGARVVIEVKLSDPQQATNSTLDLSWEYYNGSFWSPLGSSVDRGPYEFLDGTDKFRSTTGVPLFLSFLAPLDWSETEVNGEQNYWLRVRIDAGDYGQPASWDVVTEGTPPVSRVVKVGGTLKAPIIASIELQYTYQTRSMPLDHCLSYNNFTFRDHSHACRLPRQSFQAFLPNPDQAPSINFGFSQKLPSGLISMYLHVPPEGAENTPGMQALNFIWEYYTASGWRRLGVLDESHGFYRSGMIQFIGPSDAEKMEGLNGSLYRIRARLKQGARIHTAPVAGIWLNAVWGMQRRKTERDVLGISDGNPFQSFRSSLKRLPILSDDIDETSETVEVAEWTGRGAGWETTIQGIPEQDIRCDRDAATGEITTVWVRWHACMHFYNSGPGDRHYMIERTTGIFRFGDGLHGSTPPAGARIIAAYYSGGGVKGNVPAHQIAELRTASPYIMGVFNPVDAAGGAETESMSTIITRGPQQIRHRSRAVSVSDFTWLARDASSEVARVRCLPNTVPAGYPRRGWVTLVIIPFGADNQPMPSPELKRRVQDYLNERVPAPVMRKLIVVGPHYVPVSVIAEIVPDDPAEAATVEAKVLERLTQFLHPLTGGKDGKGWSFGQSVYLSHIASLIENTGGVDYASRISLNVRGSMYDERVPVNRDELVSSGAHELKLIIGENANAFTTAKA